MPEVLYQILGVLLFALGVYALVVHAQLLRRVLAINVMGVGAFMVFVASGYRGETQPPDPVPHAIVLTGIVVAVSATAFALALLGRVYATSGRLLLPEDVSGSHDDG